MSRIRKVEIRRFRCIEQLTWLPAPGLNCLVGSGDSGKSTVLDAIELCLGVRRNVQFNDGDFFKLDVSSSIEIEVTVGELADELKRIESYGNYLRGFDRETGEVLEEPEAEADTVLTVQLAVTPDLEPQWSLVSERASEEGQRRDVGWSDRLRLAPVRLGAYAEHNLSWRRGSILNRLSEEKADVSAELARIARDARLGFGETAKSQVSETLAVVTQAAEQLGIPIGEATAMLDAQSISISGGTISLHDESGVPLRGLGLGSMRLLIAGLQREASAHPSIVLVDELEHGLEPHRIHRLLNSLGAKESPPPLQVFLTSHSPVAVRELSVDQLAVLRKGTGSHDIRRVGSQDVMQATVRACPEAFLAPSVMVCEGRSEIGLMRGLDLYRIENGKPSISAMGVALADGLGDNMFRRAKSFADLGYRVLVLRDDDKKPNEDEENAFKEAGGKVVHWSADRALEDELFASLGDAAVLQLLEAAVKRVGENLIDDNIRSATDNALNLERCREEVTDEGRDALGKAAKSKAGWFKSITDMEQVAREIVGPGLSSASEHFQETVEALFSWARDGGE